MFPLFAAATILFAPILFAECDVAELEKKLVTVPEEKPPTVDMNLVSQTFGNLIGKDLKNQGLLQLELNEVMKGIKEGMAGKPTPMKPEEYSLAMEQLRHKGYQELAAHNLALANAFMACNSKSDGIVEVVPGRIQYKILKAGDGALIAEDATPLMHYKAHYLDGTLFGSSDEMGGPIPVPLAQMVPGFRKGLAGMHEGERRRIFVHPEFAYGSMSEIPPNSLLVFEVEAVKPEKPAVVLPALEVKEPEPIEPPTTPPQAVDTSSKEDDDFSTKPLLLSPIKPQ